MTSKARQRIAAGVATLWLAAAVPLMAHHGTGISYDLQNQWTTKATITEFQFKNPHPWLEFDRVNEKGENEHWTAELITNPTFLLRAGWGKARSVEALQPGTPVELVLATAYAGGFSAVVLTIRNDEGEPILDTGGPGARAGGSVPSGETRAPGSGRE
jgi:hypothetical protein